MCETNERGTTGVGTLVLLQNPYGEGRDSVLSAQLSTQCTAREMHPHPLNPSSVVARTRPFWQLFSACSPAASLSSLALYFPTIRMPTLLCVFAVSCMTNFVP